MSLLFYCGFDKKKLTRVREEGENIILSEFLFNRVVPLAQNFATFKTNDSVAIK